MNAINFFFNLKNFLLFLDTNANAAFLTFPKSIPNWNRNKKIENFLEKGANKERKREEKNKKHFFYEHFERIAAQQATRQQSERSGGVGSGPDLPLVGS